MKIPRGCDTCHSSMSQLAFDLDDADSVQAPPRPVRLIHYLGSKLRLIGPIREVVRDVAGRTGDLCDLFSGSGVVSSSLSQMRRVIAVDIQEYSRIIAAALLHRNEVRLSEFDGFLAPAEEDRFCEELTKVFAPLIELERSGIAAAREGAPSLLADLMDAGAVVRALVEGTADLPTSVRPAYEAVLARLEDKGLVDRPETTVSRYFGGLYFGFRQAIELDVLLSRAARLPTDLGDLAKASVLSAASNITPTVGNQFAQPLRPRDKHGRPKEGFWKRLDVAVRADAIQYCREALLTLVERLPTKNGGLAVRADYRDFLTKWSDPIAAFYVDPPYTRDHYSRFYHVLETMCLRDSPVVTRSKIGRRDDRDRMSRGAYRVDRHQSPFCIRSEAPQAFEDLFRGCRNLDAPVVLSYSPPHDRGRAHPRVMRTEDIERIARRYYPKVGVETVGEIAHSKLTKTDLHLEKPDLAEILLVCQL